MTPTNFQVPTPHPGDRNCRWQVRPAGLEDVSSLAEILTDSFHSREGIFGWAYPLLRLGIYEDIRHRIRTSTHHHACLVAVEKAEDTTGIYARDSSLGIVGTVELAVRTLVPGTDGNYINPYRQSDRYPYLSNLAVLHVLENNYQARQLYLKLGYQLERVDTSWSHWLFQQPRQMLLHKRLKSSNSG